MADLVNGNNFGKELSAITEALVTKLENQPTSNETYSKLLAYYG